MVAAARSRGDADAVFGSRMMVKGAARKGGMPLYKFVGNKTLTTLQNALVGTDLSEFHSGYRAYRTAALRDIDFEANSDGFDFDTEIILQLHGAGRRIVEIPIPTYYGDEICYVNGMKYGRDVLKHALDYRLAMSGLNAGIGGTTDDYPFKASPNSSHGRILTWTGGRDAVEGARRRVCRRATSARCCASRGTTSWASTPTGSTVCRERLDEFVSCNLDEGLPATVSGQFDLIMCADVLEHLRQPDELLASLRALPRC